MLTLAKELSNSPGLTNMVAANSNRRPGGRFEGECNDDCHFLLINFKLR